MTTAQPVFRHWVAILFATIFGTAASAQEAAPEPLQLDTVFPAGVRASVTESWTTLRIEVSNAGTDGRNARVAVFYPERPDVQYCKDVFVPGRSAVTSWMAVGPASEQNSDLSRKMEMLFYDRTNGRERLILPRGALVRDRGVSYRRREPTTSLLMGEANLDPSAVETPPDAAATEPLMVARSMREVSGLSEYVPVIQERFLPPTPEAFDGIDVLILASNRLDADPVGRQALRRWVQQGGSLWVQLDRTSPETVASILGDDFNFRAIDRVGQTSIRLHRSGDDPTRVEPQLVDKPVDLVQVTLGGGETLLHVANGWPAAFVQRMGRGRVIFTALGPRGWVQPRTSRDPHSRFLSFPDLPVATNPLVDLAIQLHPRPEQAQPPVESLRELLLHEVGYAAIDRATAAGIFAGFLLVLVGLGIGLRRSRRPELVGWLAPAAAVVATAVFAILGEVSRRAVPPTIGVAEIVDVVPGNREAATVGELAVYQPGSGTVLLGTESGGSLELDATGLEGRTRQRVETDFGKWHWESLNLPAGVRTGSFRSTLQMPGLSAIARFETNGVEGRLRTGSFRNAADALLVTPTREPLSVRLGSSEGFSSRDEDMLPPGQYLNAAVLTDRQQRRQAVYRQLLDGKLPRHWEGQNLLLVWTEPRDVPFQMGDGVRTVGASLLALPLEFEPPSPGSSVSIPRAFVPFVRILEGRSQPPILDGSTGVEMHLRFQLPRSVLPLTVERLRFHARVRTPSRRFTVNGFGEGADVPVHDAESPLHPILVEITEPRLLRVDADGGLHLTVKVSDQIGRETATVEPAKAPQPGGKFQPPGPGLKGGPMGGKKGGPPADNSGKNIAQPSLREPDLPWRIESLGLEVMGRTQ